MPASTTGSDLSSYRTSFCTCFYTSENLSAPRLHVQEHRISPSKEYQLPSPPAKVCPFRSGTPTGIQITPAFSFRRSSSHLDRRKPSAPLGGVPSGKLFESPGASGGRTLGNRFRTKTDRGPAHRKPATGRKKSRDFLPRRRSARFFQQERAFPLSHQRRNLTCTTNLGLRHDPDNVRRDSATLAYVTTPPRL